MRRHIIQLVLLALILTLFPVAPRTARAAVLNKAPNNLGLMGYWPLNDGNGTSAGDASGNGNTAALNNSPAWTTGKRGGALSFDNAAQKYLWASIAPISQNITLSAWIYPTSLPGERYTIIVGESPFGYYLSYAYDGSVNTYWYGKSVEGYHSSGANTVPINTWSLVTVTWDNAGTNLYVNGVLKNSVASTGTGNASTNVNIGEESVGRQFIGKIDEVRIYNRALSGTEVTALYQSGAVKMISGATPSQISGLVGWWDAADADQVRSGSDCTGTVAGGGTIGCLKDKSAAGNNMTQPTVGTRPTYQTNIKNGNAVVRMASQTLYTSTNFPAPVTVMYAAHHTGGLNGRMLSAVNNNWLLGYWGGGKRQAYFEGWVSAAGSPSSDTGWNTYSAVIPGSGQNTLVYENGTQVFSNQGGVTGPNGLTLDGEYSEYSNGETGEVLVYNRALTDAERSSLERYLNNKWAVGYSGVARATDMGISSSRNSRLTSGLVGEWSFDGPDVSGTTAYDRSGNGLNGTISGASVTPGKIGQSLKFNGTSNNVMVADNATLRVTTYTVSVWIKPQVDDDYWTGVVGKPGRNFNIWLGGSDSASGFIHHRFHDGASTNSGCPDSAGVPIDGSTWTHVVITNDGSTCRTYFNGVQQQQGAVTASLTADANNLYIGSNLDGGASNYFRGVIDDVRLYNRALSATEVMQLYSIGK